MPLKNLDFTSPSMEEARAQLFNALRTDDEVAQKEAMDVFAKGLEKSVNDQVKAAALQYQDGIQDEAILAERGLRRKLTSGERKFFAEAVEKQTISGLSKQFPETIIEDIYNNLVETHPLISLVDVQHGTVKTKFIYGDATKKRAFWGNIPADIKQILLDSFKELDISASKLSGFIALPKGYFELGPSWLANYVVTFLQEVMAAALEEAIVNGDGKNKPLGMMRKLSGDSGGIYPAKEKVTMGDLKPKTLAGIRAALAKAKTDNGIVSALANPLTYWSKLFPGLAYQTQAGVWVTTQLPTGEQIITTHAVPENDMVFGVLKNYLLVVAADVEITEYKETLAIEDMDLYVAKFFGKGIPKNENAFFVADVTTIEGATVPELEGNPAIKTEDTINPTPEL
ncbi:TPA: phage major capsid protein [Streptococcus pyogenes]|nr:phage major capsid protein [Streptococcus pyogenes]